MSDRGDALRWQAQANRWLAQRITHVPAAPQGTAAAGAADDAAIEHPPAARRLEIDGTEADNVIDKLTGLVRQQQQQIASLAGQLGYLQAQFAEASAERQDIAEGGWEEAETSVPADPARDILEAYAAEKARLVAGITRAQALLDVLEARVPGVPHHGGTSAALRERGP